MKICIDSLPIGELRVLMFSNNLFILANLWSHFCQMFDNFEGKEDVKQFISAKVMESFQFVAYCFLCRLF